MSEWPGGRLTLGGVSDGWEGVAGEWIEFTRGDAPFEWHSESFLHLFVASGVVAVLDAGCGEGRLSRRLAAAGYRVTSVDASPTLVRRAREADPRGEYRTADVTDLPFADASFDAVISFMVLQDVADYERAVGEAARVLRTGGAFYVAIVHPLTSAGDWLDGSIDSDFRVENYCSVFARERPLADRTVTQYHRPIEAYLRAADRAGLTLEALRELPTRRRAPGRLPVFLDFRARKPGNAGQ
jgi:SAM-dependent methyltransferase